MNNSKYKYLYIALAAIAAAIALYSAYVLIAHGTPLIKSYKEHIRSGNSLHQDSLYDEAIVHYARALDMDQDKGIGNYNAATNLLLKLYSDNKNGESNQNVPELYKSADSMFTIAYHNDTIKAEIASTMHNQGVLHQMADSLAKAAESYKESLRNNPSDEETRYNLAVVLYLLKKDQQQNQQNQQQKQDQQNQEQQDKQQQQQQQQDQQNQEQQDKQQQQNQQQQQEQEQEQNQQEKQQQAAAAEAEEKSKEDAERILNAIMQDEKSVQEKVKQEQNKSKKSKLQNNW